MLSGAARTWKMLWGTNMEAMRMTVVVPKQPSWMFTAVCMPPGNLCTVTSSTAGFVAWHLCIQKLRDVNAN